MRSFARRAMGSRAPSEISAAGFGSTASPREDSPLSCIGWVLLAKVVELNISQSGIIPYLGRKARQSARSGAEGSFINVYLATWRLLNALTGSRRRGRTGLALQRL